MKQCIRAVCCACSHIVGTVVELMPWSGGSFLSSSAIALEGAVHTINLIEGSSRTGAIRIVRQCAVRVGAD